MKMLAANCKNSFPVVLPLISLYGAVPRGSKRLIAKAGPLGSKCPAATLHARQMATQMRHTRKVKGRPERVPAVWSATSPSFPPATSRAVAVAPSVKAQKTR